MVIIKSIKKEKAVHGRGAIFLWENKRLNIMMFECFMLDPKLCMGTLSTLKKNSFQYRNNYVCLDFGR